MKKSYALSLFLFSCLIFLCTCKKDKAKYKDYEVDFYIAHEGFEIKQPVLETVTEQVLVRPAHKLGATFEAVYEQILIKPARLRHEIADSQKIYIVVNAETNTIAKTTCYDFFDEADFIERDVPAEYRTRLFYRLLTPGTGMDVPAEYQTITKQRLVTDSEIAELEGERSFNRLAFRVPVHMTIREYLADQFSQQSILDCEEGNSFRILE